MLLFIRCCILVISLKSSISKHLMLLFIRRRTLNRFTTDISKHLMLLFIIHSFYTKRTDLYFKTSYVIVYLSGVMNLAAASGFQNILCYCLSCTVDPFQRLQFVFQNILCYCLSTLRYLALWSF